ncbi:MAG: Demethylmenaquinone methyltransferase [Planctomycetota bacterium]|jgi:ArsR family transcriptional regulator
MSTAGEMFDWLQVLSDPTRARLLRLLERNELTVVELCQILQSPQSTISRHLKVLSDSDWVSSRKEGTSSWYRLQTNDLQSGQRRLWQVVREQAAGAKFAEYDDARLEKILDERQSRAQAFFSSAADQWDKLRSDLFGGSVNCWALAASLGGESVVGELGCGTAPLSLTLSPLVKQVIAVDSSAAMIKAARSKLKKCENVEFRRGDLSALPIGDQELDVVFIVLVLAYLHDPRVAIAEAYRTLKPGGRLVLIDMLRHDRESLKQELGHLWLGFEWSQIDQWLKESRIANYRKISLPPEQEAKGPPLFCVAVEKRS